MNIKELSPGLLWKYFHELTRIPRPSKHEEKAVEYVANVGKNLGLETYKDHVGNVVIIKPATSGYENKKVVVLQSHLDMVPQKNKDTVHDFKKDPIEAYVDGEWVTAKETTLGADNGIGVAAILALLESTDIEHGPLIGLFTIDEETGMTGAFSLEPGFVKGDILLNLDTEDDREICIGCAGGVNLTATLDYKKTEVPGNHLCYKVSLTGLKGGHSGIDIHLGRGNANKLMNRFLWHVSKTCNARICSLHGGGLRNAIPRESFAEIVVPVDKSNLLLEKTEEYSALFKKEFMNLEPGIKMSAVQVDIPASVMDLESQDKILKAIQGVPNGVIRMSPVMKELVETSSNLATIKVEEGKVEIMSLLRSSLETGKDDISLAVQHVYELAGAKVELSGSYPGWTPNFDSPVLSMMKEVYRNLFNEEPHQVVVHAGLECGIIGSVYPNLDMVSFGPTIKFPHSPDEKVHVGSVQKFYTFLVEILQNIPAHR